MLELFDYPTPLISSTLDHSGACKKFSASKFWKDLTIQFVWEMSTHFVDFWPIKWSTHNLEKRL